MKQIFAIRVFKRVLYRASAVVMLAVGVGAGVAMARDERSVWPLLAAVFLAFISWALWVASTWSLKVDDDGLELRRGRKAYRIPWGELGEFAPGYGIDRHKVEFTLADQPPLAEAYAGRKRFMPRTPRFLPDTFGLKAAELAELLNRKKAESVEQAPTPVLRKAGSSGAGEA